MPIGLRNLTGLRLPRRKLKSTSFCQPVILPGIPNEAQAYCEVLFIIRFIA